MNRNATVLGSAALLIVTSACSSSSDPRPENPEQLGLGLQERVPESNSFTIKFGSDSELVSWADTLPPVGNQGQQGSCVGWALGYYVKTSWEARAEGWDPTLSNHQFSPAWIYNQINGGVDNGSWPGEALDLLERSGAATMSTMPYDPRDYSSQPSEAAFEEASAYPNEDGREYGTYDPTGLISYLNTTGPLVLGIYVHDNFYDAGSDYLGTGGSPRLGAHAIACVGYDPDRNGGSFELMNSWGTTWGNQGRTFVPGSALGEIFLGAWTMVDGPNSSTDSGGGGVHTPNNFTASSLGTIVNLTWDPVSAAQGYRLEWLDGSGQEVVANLSAGQVFTQVITDGTDEAVEFLLYAIAGSEVSEPARAVADTGNGDSIAEITLSASNPDNGAAFPDKIALEWTSIGQSGVLYALFRGATISDFAEGTIDVLALGVDKFHFDDLVPQASIYTYAVAALDSTSEELLGLSTPVEGATSGAGGGFDLGILDAYADTVVTRGTEANGQIAIRNYSSAPTNAWVQVGIEYDNGGFGILFYDEDGTPLFSGVSPHRSRATATPATA